MAPSSGHLLVSKALRFIRFATDKTSNAIRSTVPQTTQTTSTKAVTYAQPPRVSLKTQPIPASAFLKQSRVQHSRIYNNPVNRYFSSRVESHAPKYDRSSFPISRTSKFISQRGSAPFATSLRPNLTGGALPRSAGGYSLGGAGKARHFSHTVGCQAQVINNVNAGIRAFFIGGGKARYDGVDEFSGEKRFRCVSKTEDTACRKWENPASVSMRGTSLEFRLSPTITALSPAFSASGGDGGAATLNTSGLLEALSGDLARAVRDLAIVLNDINKLSALGDLPISLHHTAEGPILSVRFPGCDGDLVASLCDEVGVRRGLIKEDEDWVESKEVEMALLFPFAPTTNRLACSEQHSSGPVPEEYFDEKPFAVAEKEAKKDQLDWRNMLSPSNHSLGFERQSDFSFEEATLHSPSANHHSPSGYESLRESDFASDDPYYHAYSPQTGLCSPSKVSASQEYEGLEGIYKFLQVCDDARR